MSEWVSVGKAGGLAEGEMTSFSAADRMIAVANIEGDLQAFDDTCTHQGCSLSEGELDGTIVECPCHGGRYEVMTGEVVGGPPPEPIDVFEIREQDGELQIRILSD